MRRMTWDEMRREWATRASAVEEGMSQDDQILAVRMINHTGDGSYPQRLVVIAKAIQRYRDAMRRYSDSLDASPTAAEHRDMHDEIKAARRQLFALVEP